LLSDIRRALYELGRNRPALVATNLFLLPWFLVIVTGRNTDPWHGFAVIFGIIGVYWLFTRGREFVFLPARRPAAESLLAVAIVVGWMAFRVGQYQEVLELPRVSLLSIADIYETIVPKLGEMVVLPLAIWFALGYRPGALGLRARPRDWLPAMVLAAALVAFGLSRHSPASLGERTFYYYLGAGLPEEVLFRGILQSRLESLTKSPVWGLYLASLIFGISHLPINLNNAAPDNWISAFESAFTFQFSVGFALGYAFQRVRNVIPLTFLHALINSSP
jgi:membrane protease YdiL (CAAX protease family)